MESELNELSLTLAKKSVKTRGKTADWYYGGSEDLSSESLCLDAKRDNKLSPRHDPPKRKPPAWRNQFMSEHPIGKTNYSQ